MALAKDLKACSVNRKYRRSDALEAAAGSLWEEEKRKLRRELGL